LRIDRQPGLHHNFGAVGGLHVIDAEAAIEMAFRNGWRGDRARFLDNADRARHSWRYVWLGDDHLGTGGR
jgi:hypothetical protein